MNNNNMNQSISCCFDSLDAKAMTSPLAYPSSSPPVGQIVSLHEIETVALQCACIASVVSLQKNKEKPGVGLE